MSADFSTANTAAERRRAMRALLATPFIAAGQGRDDTLALVRRHASHLSSWLSANTGWRLVCSSDHARLYKSVSVSRDGTRGLRDPRSDELFTRTRYALLCLALAALERADRQTTLGRLAQDVMQLTALDPALEAAGFTFDLSSQSQRRDLVTVVRTLIDLQILRHLHGDEQQFIADRGDALYNVSRANLAVLLDVRRGPSTVDAAAFHERLRLINEEARPDTDDARNQAVRWRLTRALLDDPVLYFDDLSPEERAYWQSQSYFLMEKVKEATGMVVELRAEGVAMVDPDGELTDVGIPEEGTDGHLTLLMAEFLALTARQVPGAPLSQVRLEQQVADLIDRYGTHWRKDVRQPGAERVLARDVVERLQALGLVRRTADGVVPLPAIARYSVESITLPGAQPS